MSLFRALRHRPFALLWSGQTLSRVGDHLYELALAWWVLQKTGSAVMMSAVLIFSFTPMLLFLLIGGVAVDRLPRVRLMLLSDVGRGVVVGGVAALAYAQLLEVWHVLLASIDSFGSFVLLPIGFGLAGWATETLGASLVFVLGGAITAALALLALAHPAIRGLD
ncbi:MAG: MFS transporter [Chloroflexi bacterium]|nr:MFS transporter [Chloroflexota bacterium]